MMEYKIESSNVKIRKFLESLMPSFIKQLGLTNSKRAVLVKVTKDLDKDFQGATMNIEVADCMIVLIKPPNRLTPMSLMDMSSTLAHEMVHVKQLAKGQMKLLPNEVRMWKGKRYSKKTKYLDMPWEIDAFSKQELLLRRALEL
jgi:hypothetical protein